MCNSSCIEFGKRMLTSEIVKSKSVIELGSLDVNGSIRYHVKSLQPSRYIGVDMVAGKGVDVICKAENILDVYGKESFDIVISTEMMEHVEDWKKVINNIKLLCKCGGYILITTRSYGFAKHDWPNDYWRYEVCDMEQIFSDMSGVMEKDPSDIGVFVFAKKPFDYVIKDLSECKLYSMVKNSRT